MPIAVAAAEPAWVEGNDPPPYRFIAKKLLRGEVVPFLGAGASVLNHSPNCPPTGSGLTRLLAQEAGFPEDPDLRPDLPLVASYFARVAIDRPSLYEFLNSIFKPEFAPNDLHRLLADVARHQNLLIITTNYDDMIERALDGENQEKVPYHLVVTAIEDVESGGTVKYKAPGHKGDFADVEPSKLDVSLENASIIYKMHGSIARPGAKSGYYVITEEDYIRFLGRMSIIPEKIVASMTLRENNIKRFLFLGYSLGDWNFRVMLDMLWNIGKGRDALRSFAIQRRPNRVEAKIWGTKDVSIYDLDLREFTHRLRKEIEILMQEKTEMLS